MYKVEAAKQPQVYQLIDIILGGVFKDIPERTTLSRRSKTGTMIARTIDLEQQKYNVSRYLNFAEYNQTIKEFYERLDDNFASYDLASFYQNLKTFRVHEKSSFSKLLEHVIKKEQSDTRYDTVENSIYIEDKNLKGKITHQLLRMATTRQNESVIFCGFSQFYKERNMGIGDALNTGYTEYLNKKYFQADELDNSYLNEQVIAQGIEKIVGKNKMESLYFKSDLKGLVDELAKYTSIDNIMTLLRSFDSIHKSQLPEESKQEDFRELRKVIAAIYLEKQKQLLEAGKITPEEYNDKKMIHGDIYVKENVAFDAAAQVIRKNNMIKVIDSNRGVALITSTAKYDHNKEELLELVEGQYSYHDDYQKAVEEEHKVRG